MGIITKILNNYENQNPRIVDLNVGIASFSLKLEDTVAMIKSITGRKILKIAIPPINGL